MGDVLKFTLGDHSSNRDNKTVLVKEDFGNQITYLLKDSGEISQDYIELVLFHHLGSRPSKLTSFYILHSMKDLESLSSGQIIEMYENILISRREDEKKGDNFNNLGLYL